MLTNKGKHIDVNGKTKFTPNEKLKQVKVKEDDKVKVIINERVKKDSFGKVIKTNPKVPLSLNRKNNTNNNSLHIHPHKFNKCIVNPSNSIDKPSPKLNRKPGGQTYAVNYCMCGPRKGKKNTFVEEQIMDTYIKSSNDFIQEANLPNIRRSKPILSLPSSELAQQDHNKNKTSCGSDCVCLNKVPSSKSIDNLLDTLMKWKCDMNASNNVCSDLNCPYSSEFIVNSKKTSNNQLIQELVNSMSNAIKSRSMTRVAHKSATRKSNLLSTQMTLVNSNVNQPVDGNRSLSMHPMTLNNTQSEYMGAINLEKSNENNCKCTFRVDKTTVDMDVNTDVCWIQQHESRRQTCSQDINVVLSTPRNEDLEVKRNIYLNATPYPSYDRKVLKKPDDRSMGGKVLYYKSSQIHNRASQVDGSVRLFLDGLKEIVEDKSNIAEAKSKMLDNILITEKDKPKMVEDQSKECHPDRTLEIDQIAQPSISPCDCDYEIKFMGVTLRDANENKDANKNKRINNEHKQNANEVKLELGDGPGKIEANKYSTHENIDFGQYFSNITSKLSLGKLVENRQNEGNNYCLCNINISDFKELIADFNTHNCNRDIGLDTKSLAETEVSKQSACVCCYKDKEEDQNLEVNTFYLLKEHLKQKLEEFKENCQSSCIPPEEENKVFTLIFEKIKQTISEAADQAICKCAEGEPSDGTWKRAYCLLQEYLKTKISRVHCKCPYPVEYNDSLVPDVSTKVCILIEKDFQRLKGLCKCLNTPMKDKKSLAKTFQIQLPENDNMGNAGKVSKQVSNTSIIITQTASAQVQSNIIMETKSCEVVQETIEEQTGVKIINLSAGPKTYSPDTAEFILSQCHSTIMDKHSSHESKIIAPIASVILSSMDITKYEDTQNKDNQRSLLDITNDEDTQNKENQLSLPLIGYTVDCTCNSYLDTCVCSKATIQKNNRKIEEIWYEVLSKSNKKVEDNNTSYIMDNVKSTTSKSVDKMCLHEIPRDVCIHHLTSIDNVQQVNRELKDNKTSAENMYVDLKLKDSSQKPVCTTVDDSFDVEMISNPESDHYADSSFSALYGYVPQTTPVVSDSLPVSVPGRTCLQRTKSEMQTDHFSKSYMQSCDCSNVPICHVKMLVKNIERKLIQSDCICDSMNYKVCPIHSIKKL